MKNECDIVKDLLFSYNDCVLSDTSKEFVESHLKNCESCNNVLKEIRQEDVEMPQEKEIDALKGVRKKISKRNITIFISLIVLILIVIFNVMVFVNYNNVTSTMEVFLEDNITEEQLEDIKNAVNESAREAEITYVSKKDALKEVQSWAGTESITSEIDVKENNPMRASFRIKADKKEIQRIVDAIQDMPGIKQIKTNLSMNPYELFVCEMLS